jgi:hypothetical protein
MLEIPPATMIHLPRWMLAPDAHCTTIRQKPFTLWIE